MWGRDGAGGLDSCGPEHTYSNRGKEGQSGKGYPGSQMAEGFQSQDPSYSKANQTDRQSVDG